MIIKYKILSCGVNHPFEGKTWVTRRVCFRLSCVEAQRYYGTDVYPSEFYGIAYRDVRRYAIIYAVKPLNYIMRFVYNRHYWFIFNLSKIHFRINEVRRRLKRWLS